MDTYSRHPGWWGYHQTLPRPRSIIELIAAGTLDAELAALLWLLIEGRVPIVVAGGPPLAGKTTVLTALLDFLTPTTRRQFLDGSMEEFGWLPEAVTLGWRGNANRLGQRGRDPEQGLEHDDSAARADPATTFLLASELSSHLPVYTWGERARIVIRALSLGYGLGTTIHGDSLGDVLAQLRGPEIDLTDDELSRLGVVLVLRLVQSPGGKEGVQRRIAAAHYVRPLARDAGGHLQRLGPAVLATWDERRDAYEHFAWGVVPELAGRIGRRAGDFELEQGKRATYLTGLVAGGLTGIEDVRVAIARYLDPSTAATAR